jgi:hypothetical protein
MVWRSHHGGLVAHVWGPGRVDEAVQYTGHDPTSPRTLLGITSRLEGRLADRPLAERSGEET